MSVTAYLQSGGVSCLLAICFLCRLCQSETDITTSSIPATHTQYVGTAYVTEFAKREFAIAKFLGIAYAKPPLRFAKPVLDTPRKSVIHAKQFGHICPQIVTSGDQCNEHQHMGEDCLFLNIYVPLHNIDNERLGVSVKSTTTPSVATGTTPASTSTTFKSHISPEVPSISIRPAVAPISVNADSVSLSTSTSSIDGSSTSQITVSSLISTLAQAEKQGNDTAFDPGSTNITEEIWSADNVTMKPSAPSAIDNDQRPLLLPTETKHAVFVYLHGGAFVVGSGNCYDGSVLAGHGNIIVVTVNYRLGNLGFLSTNDDVIPGNLGLWDQHVAIQWVKKHIRLFGGDPDRITVGGQSAGSYSSIYQALYQGNDGLFQRVLAQSGTPTAVKSASVTGYNSTLEVAKRLNCYIEGTKQEVKSCLMSKTAESLVNACLPMLVPGSLPIQPTVDDSFVTVDPYTILSQMATPGAQTRPPVPGYFTSKDLLIGLDAQDGDVAWRINAVLASRSNSTIMYGLLESTIKPKLFKTLIRMHFQHDFNETVDEYVLNAVLDRYIDWEHPEDYSSQSNRVIDFFTDVFFAIPVMDTASAHSHLKDDSFTNHHGSASENKMDSQITQGGTFVYRFNLPAHTDSSIPWFQGTGHASELDYVFGDERLQDESDIALSKNMMTYWSNFVKSGNPNRDSPLATPATPKSPDALPLWREYDNQGQQYLEISDNPVSKGYMRASFRHFWTQNIPQLQQHLQKVCKKGAESVITGDHLHEQRSGQANSGQAMLDISIFVGIVLSGISLTLTVM